MAKKNAKSLIIPYAATSLLLIILTFIAKHGQIRYLHGMGTTTRTIIATLYGIGTSFNFHGYQVPSVGAIWFLLAMFIGNQLFNLTTTRKNPKLLWGLPLLFSILGFLVSKIVLLPLSIHAALLVQPFYLFGYVIKQKQISIDSLKLALLGAGLWLLSSITGVFYVVVGVATNPLLAMIGGIGGSYTILYISEKIAESTFAKPFLFFGKHSLIMLCIHLLDLNLLDFGKIIFDKYGLFFYVVYRVVFVLLFTALFVGMKKIINKRLKSRLQSDTNL